MNSTIQCLKNNLNGTAGILAVQYAKLIKSLWLGNNVTVAPRNLKQALAKFAPRFSGYLQHDSQELLVFLLDGLHEDLNQVNVVVAEESLRNHRQRNISVIDERFIFFYKKIEFEKK
eukprot:GSMAST32.ASY1.ANO1.419.1 assembled CDS